VERFSGTRPLRVSIEPEKPVVPQRLGISTTMAAQEPERTAEAVRRSLPQAKLDPELPCGATKRSGK